MSALTIPEKRLLGAVMEDNRHVQFLGDGVTGAEFMDARVGMIWDKVTAAIAAGQVVDSIWVSNAIMDDPNIRGIGPEEVWDWTPNMPTPPTLAVEYAQAVKLDANRRAVKNNIQAAGQRMTDGDDPLAVAADSARWMQDVVNAGNGTRHLQPKLLREVLEVDDEYDWIIPGLLERQDRLILTGGEGVGKTTFARQLVVLAAAGLHPLRFERMHPVKCLVIDAENTERQWRRYVKGLAFDAAEQGVIDPRDHILMHAGTRLDLTQGPDLAEIHRLIDRHQPDLLYIGPLYKLVPKAIYSDDDAAPLIVALDSLRERGLALVMEAHAGKAKDHAGDRNLEPRGSSQLLGWPEFGFGLRQNRDDPFSVDVVRWRGDREANREWPTVLHRGTPWPWVDGSPTNGD